MDTLQIEGLHNIILWNLKRTKVVDTFQIEGLHNDMSNEPTPKLVVATRNAARLQIEGLHNIIF